MHSLYPVIKPYQEHILDVESPHKLYIEETGNKQGVPVLILHPGPGGGTSSDNYLRRFFDPEVYRIIIFDQRGCGRSTPHAEILHNSTSHLLDDINSIRDYLGIKSLMLSGGGWGCLLALLFAQKYPQHVSCLLLHRIFLGRKKDIAWFYKQGANLIYPDYWQEFVNQIPEKDLHNVPQFYADRLNSDNELARMSAAKNWALWQARCSSLQPHQSLIDYYSDPHFALSLATLETCYLINRYFIEENQVLDNVDKIKHIPIELIHGRYDMVCPLAIAWDLHQALPLSHLSIVRDAGHFDREPGMIDAIITITKELVRHHLNIS